MTSITMPDKMTEEERKAFIEVAGISIEDYLLLLEKDKEKEKPKKGKEDANQ